MCTTLVIIPTVIARCGGTHLNSSYAVGRGRRISNSRPTWAKVAARPCLKNKNKGLAEWFKW
jgi:hypothetical protein